MSKANWIFSLILAGIFAIPMVTFISAFVVFPLFFYAFFGLFAVLGWIPLLFAGRLERWWSTASVVDYTTRWQMCLVIWAGCAYGLSHWGDIGRTMGATNEPYAKMFFAPVWMLASYIFA